MLLGIKAVIAESFERIHPAASSAWASAAAVPAGRERGIAWLDRRGEETSRSPASTRSRRSRSSPSQQRVRTAAR
ncbi:MAG: hypothetical protein R2843_13310 [Thermomicrobiales bacterium]